LVRTYTTKSVPRGAKVAFWNGLHSRLFQPVQITPQDSLTFDAEAGTEVLGPVTFTRTSSPPATIELAGDDSPLRYSLVLPIAGGNIHVSYHGTEAELEAGDFVIIDSRPPSRLSFAQANQSIILTLTPATLSAHLADAERLCGVPVHGEGGMGRVAAGMIKCLWQELVVGLPSEMGATIASNLLDVIATAYATEHRIDIHGATRAKARKLQVKRFVEAHLRDPRLSPKFIADSLQLSSRYVRLLFAEEEEHLSSYILRRRLEKCAEQIRRTAWTRTTISDVAFSWGFSSMSHFARVFRAQYGMTAREYRRTASEPY
jgi:AraC-like DNA-binding protein